MNALASSSRSGTVALASMSSSGPRSSRRATRATAPRRSVDRSAPFVRRASGKDDGGDGGIGATVEALVSVTRSAVDAASNLVPESVPRPVAKTGISVVAALFVLSLVGKLISTVLFVVVFVAGGYFLLQQQGSGGKGGGGGGKGGGSGGSDALEEARRIMEKYK